MKKDKLTPKQMAFVDYYIQTLNASEAYSKAFNNTNMPSCGVSGHRLLKNDKVAKAIDERMEQLQNERILSAEEVLEFLSSVVNDKEAKLQDRIRSAELLGKRHKLFTDKMEMDNQVDIVVNLDGLEME